MSDELAIVSKETRKRLNTFLNQIKKPHQKSDDFIINKGLDALENKPKLLHEEIEEGEFSIGFPSQ